MNLNPIDSFFKIAAIADMVCDELHLSVAHHSRWFLNRALWHYAQAKMDMSNDVQSDLLPISDALTVICPVGMIDWVKVGIPYGQYIITLCVNNQMGKNDRTDPLDTKAFPPGWLPNGIDVTAYGGGYEFSNYQGRALYSIGGGFPSIGHFIVTRRSDGVKEIKLNNNLPIDLTEIYLEWIGLGLNACGETIVDPYMGEWLRKVLHHEHAKHPFAPYVKTEIEIERTGRELFYEERKVRGRYNQLTPENILMATRRNYRLTPRA